MHLAMKLVALMAITTSLLVQPSVAVPPNYSQNSIVYIPEQSWYCGESPEQFNEATQLGTYYVFRAEEWQQQTGGPVAEAAPGTIEGLQNLMREPCNGELFNFDSADQEKCRCVASAAFVFFGSAEAAGTMKSVYIAYKNALNGNLQRAIETAARRLVKEARESTVRVCVVLVNLLHAGLNSERVDLEDFTAFYGKVIEELGCSDV